MGKQRGAQKDPGGERIKVLGGNSKMSRHEIPSKTPAFKNDLHERWRFLYLKRKLWGQLRKKKDRKGIQKDVRGDKLGLH